MSYQRNDNKFTKTYEAFDDDSGDVFIVLWHDWDVDRVVGDFGNARDAELCKKKVHKLWSAIPATI